MKQKSVIVCIFALVAIHLCTGQNNTGTDDSAQKDIVTDEKTALQKGMDPIFDLYHNFLDTVMSKNFYDANSAPFNIHTVIEITQKNDYSQLQSKWQDLVKTFGGYAGCIIVGLLFVVFMPIVGLIYCCCHCCCHKCGGTREMMDPKRASCKRWTYTIILLICATLMLAGGIITFLGSELLHKSLKNEDNSGLVGKLDDSLGHLQTFTNDTINDIVHIAKEKIINEGLGKILPEIKDAADRTVTKVKKKINAEQLLDEAAALGEVATTVLDDLKNLKEQVTRLQDLQTNVSTKLSAVKADVVDACNSSCGGVDDKVQGLNFNPNYTQLKDQQQKIDEVAKAVNISAFVEEASREFDNVSKEVDDKVESEITNAENQVNKMNNTINRQIGNISNQTKPFMDSVKEGQDFATNEQETFKDIADYIWYACIGMGCAVILVVFFYYMGVLFGLCGERPGPRAACCNRETGAHLLCTGICCSFLFAWILMLVVILLFTLGGLSYSMACKYISNGVENVDTFESVLSDGFSWDISESFGVENLTIAQMFQNCKDDMGIYSALHLQYIFDIDKEFNLSDVKAEVRKMEDTTLTLPNITLLSPGLKTQLNDYKQAAVSDINFTEYTTELDKPLFGSQQLLVVISDLTDAADTLDRTQPGIATDLRKAAADLKKLNEEEIAEINEGKTYLSASLKSLQDKAQVSVPDSIGNLTDSIKKSEDDFNNNKDSIVIQELKVAVEDILTIIEETVNSTKLFIKYDVGKCRPLYDAAQSVVDAVCVVTLDPLNAIWFGLGWSLFFYIPCFIFAALLANLYKRTEKYKKKDHGFDDPIHSQYTGYDDYRGNRHEDNVPLTSMGKDQRYSSNGAYNQGYQGREYEHEPRYHRDEASGYPPDNYSRDRGVPRGSAGHHYAQPHADPYDQPPRYDDAVSDRYDRVSRHGGYPRLSNY
ncbi:prominin-1-A-like isoform X2 [Mercenaria mercenaria]|uniref:prominin-1-A-like isoform X2 n=1 Tax=Mercenaria mercenaria TaxID=6596 RepID=UPI00234E4F3E|nr:prominin-1-A-like isoform X2 [Mercenaria mercenaria]XP_045212570.2 prominin-1-A-like isoform X2 [Mercenaria mercenaria]